jgi:hypothetical protein
MKELEEKKNTLKKEIENNKRYKLNEIVMSEKFI